MRKLKAYYQKVQFYRRRFLKNLNVVEMFFRDQGLRDQIPEPHQEKAIKLLKMIGACASAFSQRFFSHFRYSFMAL